MMGYKKQIFLALTLIAFTVQAQDSTKTLRKTPERRNEIGVSLIVPLIIAIGATDYNERYTNLTHRYFLSQKQALKSFVGISTVNNLPDNPRVVSATRTSTVYQMNYQTTPSNVQIGLGYEYIMGNKKLKHAVGMDVYYNNKFVKNQYYYYRDQDSLHPSGQTVREYSRIDTGGYVKTRNYDKLGINLSYSLRYEFSKKWLITASCIMTNKLYWDKKQQGSRTQTYEMNFAGLVSDISIYYRFK